MYQKFDVANFPNILQQYKHNKNHLIISFFHFFIAKVLVVTGFPTENGKHLEIIDLIDPILKNDVFVDKMTERHGCFGGIFQNQLFICGGFDDDFSCPFCSYSASQNSDLKKHLRIVHKVDYGQGNNHPGHPFSKECNVVLPKYKESFQMLEKRIDASSVEINQDTLWITGGHEKKSSEIVSMNFQPTVKGKELPFTIHYHSMVAVDQHTIFIIGGKLDGTLNGNFPTNKTWVIDPTNNFDLKPGPSLQVGRLRHSSSKIKINEKIYLVVAGGIEFGRIDSVELLDTTSPDQGWIIGKYNYQVGHINSFQTRTSFSFRP